MTLNNSNLNYSQLYSSTQQQFFYTTNVDGGSGGSVSGGGSSNCSTTKQTERPKTLQSSLNTYQNDSSSIKSIYRDDYYHQHHQKKNRSNSFGGILLNNDANNSLNDGENDIEITLNNETIFNNIIEKNHNRKMQNDFRLNLKKTTISSPIATNAITTTKDSNAKIDDLTKINKKVLKKTQQQQQRTKNFEDMLSPFDEEEAWAKISEIMESFGSGILSSSSDDKKFTKRNSKNNKISSNLNDDDNDDDEDINDANDISSGHYKDKENENPSKYKLRMLFNENNLEHLSDILIENGFDNIEFLVSIIINKNKNKK